MTHPNTKTIKDSYYRAIYYSLSVYFGEQFGRKYTFIQESKDSEAAFHRSVIIYVLQKQFKLSDPEIIKVFGVSKRSLYRYSDQVRNRKVIADKKYKEACEYLALNQFINE